MMMDKNELAKIGLAFAVGVSLSAGYVAIGTQRSAPEVIVVQEQCPDPDEGLGEQSAGLPRGLVLAPLRGEAPVPEGFELWLSLDGLWSGDAGGEPLLELEGGRFGEADVERHLIRALEPIAREQAKSTFTAVLWIDHRVPGQTLIDLLYTLGRAGFQDFALVSAGRGSPEAFLFGAQRYGVSTRDNPRTAALSLRLESEGVSAWLGPSPELQMEEEPPEALPLRIGQAGADTCMLGAPLPEASQIATLEQDLCELESGPLAVEYVVHDQRSVGDLLALRALDARSGTCRGPSSIAAPYSTPEGCAGALPTDEALARLVEAKRQSSAPKASVEGPLAKELVREVVKAHIGEVRHCYNEGLAHDPELGGSVVVEFVIDEHGDVVESSILGKGTDLADRKVSRCITKAIERWKFPKPEEGEAVVTYPFILSPG